MTERSREALRIEELLVERATSGLDPSGKDELDRLLAAHPDVDGDAFDRAAAGVDLAALSGATEAMPSGLAARILADGERMVAARAAAAGRSGTGTASAPGVAAADSAASRPGKVVSPDFRGRSMRSSLTGWMAAAAAVLIAVLAWPRGGTAPAPAELRAALMADAGDALTVDWAATEDPASAGASGDVVWSTDRQQGTMRIRGLAVNDPAEYQYQLWIFDAQRDERFPVDGGVFDMESGEVVVPIDAKIPVGEPVLFAVTVEKPGGVVVSDRERIVLVAQVAG